MSAVTRADDVRTAHAFRSEPNADRSRISLAPLTVVPKKEKRELLLGAAVRVFARKGYHTCRVGDIAEEAGVAHGLLYHYFSSKEEVLQTIFRDTWGLMLETIESVQEPGESARESLRKVAAIVLRTWGNDPDLIRVLVREVARSPHIQHEIEEVDQAFATLRSVIERGQTLGEFRPDIDPEFAATIFYGALEEILTGWVLGQLPDGEEDVARAEQTVVEMLCGGLEQRA
jgi:TetR/AcrR family transcriptional regulator, fatty acid metabolism regulator protein